MSVKEVKSFRLDREVINSIKDLKYFYSEQYHINVTEAHVVELLVKEKLSQIKGEK
jgi:hypothetical protein